LRFPSADQLARNRAKQQARKKKKSAKATTEKAGRGYGVNAGLAFRTKPKSVKNWQSGLKFFSVLSYSWF